MKKIEFKLDGKRYTRVSKVTAKRLYEKESKEIFIIPCLTRPDNAWSIGGYLTPNVKDNKTFDQVCNMFSYYNCNSELGKYLAYYVKESEVV